MAETTDDEAAVARLDDGRVAPAVAAIGSVALALNYYYVRGEKQRGQFIGFWSATILGIATYIKLEEIRRLLQVSGEYPLGCR